MGGTLLEFTSKPMVLGGGIFTKIVVSYFDLRFSWDTGHIMMN